MATTTPNFGWSVPTSTDLVKDGATAIETLGDSIDASLVDLKGGTTGQVLAKASNTDMDFTWVTDAAGDITGVTAGTGITGGGTSGSVTVSFDQANFGGGQFAAGKNKIINGDFNIWQRGTSFTNPADSSYTADRFEIRQDGNGTKIISQQTFTPGTAPVAGYEGQYFFRWNDSVAGSTQSFKVVSQKIEDVRTFAGQTVTMSFWAKADASRTLTYYWQQNFGSGGSAVVDGASTTASLTTSWQRFSYTVAVTSVSGKTIGAGSNLRFRFDLPLNVAQTIDIWGVQMEAGSTATPFQTATGTLQGELAACQRYYWRAGGSTTYQAFGTGIFESSTAAWLVIENPVVMRSAPSSVDWSTLTLFDGGTLRAVTGVPAGELAPNICRINVSVASGGTQFRPVQLFANNSTSGYIGFSAEL
jgi:hypothetical protein